MKKAVIIAGSIVLFVILISILASFTIVSPGERGLRVKLGVITTTPLSEGIYWKTPFIEQIVIMGIKTQKAEYGSESASKDLQNVTTKVALNYHPEGTKVNELYQKIGADYEQVIIQPAIQEAIKSTTAKFTAEELITKRTEVKSEIRSLLEERLKNSWIVVDDLNIINFDFAPEFNKAIEQKQVSEQLTLKATNDLARIKVEAQQTIESAKAQAESLRLQKQELTPELVQMKAIEKWNGVLPQYTGSNTPILNLKQP